MEMIFFGLFALVLFGSYIIIRRQLAPVGMTAALCVVGSIITMTLYQLERGAMVIQGFAVGTGLGIIFSIATLSIAWYFHSNELRAAYLADQQAASNAPQEDYEQYEEYYEQPSTQP